MKRLLVLASAVLLCGFTYGYKNNKQTGKPDLVVVGATPATNVQLSGQHIVGTITYYK